MDRWENGMLAKSLAGHDKGKIYVIISQDDRWVYLADGEIRKLENPKKKKKIHVQLIRRKYEIEEADDVRIKQILKVYRNQETGMKEES